MEQSNITEVNVFILLAFPNLSQFQPVLFTVVLMLYNICLLGNVTIIFLIRWDSSLYTPMYFFISTFAVLEILFVSIIVPKFLHILLTDNNRISYIGCFVQMHTSDSMGSVECYLLAVMTFDRDLAINNPFNYYNIMSKIKIKLAVGPWIIGISFSSILTIFAGHLEFCGRNELDHFFCDLAPLQNLACSGSFVSRIATTLVAVFAILLPFSMIIGFYSRIIGTISKIKNAEGKQKAFSTCSSHLIVSSLFFGTAIMVYIRPNTSWHDKYFALIYTFVTPALNPFIYTLRNRDVKKVLFKFLGKKKHRQLRTVTCNDLC